MKNEGPVQTCLGTKMDVVQARQCPELKVFVNNWEKVLTVEESGTKLI